MKSMRKNDFEKALAKIEKDRLKKKNACNFWEIFSDHHLSWMKELVQKYKEAGDYPLIPMTILPSYYTDDEDKEIAAFASLLIKDDGNFDRVNAFRKILTDHPSEWFKERGFVRLSLGSMQNKKTGGVENWKIAKLFDRLWENCHITTRTAPNGVAKTFMRPIGYQVGIMAEGQCCSYYDILTYILEDCSVGEYLYKIRLLLLVLGLSDGLSFGLWSIPKRDIKSPVTSEIKGFLKAWMPNYSIIGTFDEAVDMFKLGSPGDFFYAYLAWNKLHKLNPKACERYLSIYKGWYVKKDSHFLCEWKRIQPDITFV